MVHRLKRLDSEEEEASTSSDDSPAFNYLGHLIHGQPLAFSIREFCLAHRILSAVSISD